MENEIPEKYKEERRLQILERLKALEIIDPTDPDANERLAEYKQLEAELLAIDPVRTDHLPSEFQKKTPNLDNRAAIDQLFENSEK